ncbi:hypothetical protein ACFX13_032002 [Malus domestica]
MSIEDTRCLVNLNVGHWQSSFFVSIWFALQNLACYKSFKISEQNAYNLWAPTVGKNWRRCASLRVSEPGLASLQWLRKGKVAMVGGGKRRMWGRGESRKGMNNKFI